MGEFMHALNPRLSWHVRRWYLAGVIARHLPRDVVSQSVKRMILEAMQDVERDRPLDVPVGEYTRAWHDRTL